MAALSNRQSSCCERLSICAAAETSPTSFARSRYIHALLLSLNAPKHSCPRCLQKTLLSRHLDRNQVWLGACRYPPVPILLRPVTPPAHNSPGPLLPWPVTPPAHNSPGPLLPWPVTPPAHNSPGPLLLRPVTPPAHYS